MSRTATTTSLSADCATEIPRLRVRRNLGVIAWLASTFKASNSSSRADPAFPDAALPQRRVLEAPDHPPVHRGGLYFRVEGTPVVSAPSFRLAQLS